jgi:hypothetical protein
MSPELFAVEREHLDPTAHRIKELERFPLLPLVPPVSGQSDDRAPMALGLLQSFAGSVQQLQQHLLGRPIGVGHVERIWPLSWASVAPMSRRGSF